MKHGLPILLLFSLCLVFTGCASVEPSSMESGSRSAIEGFPAQLSSNPLVEEEAVLPSAYLSQADEQGTLTTISYESVDRAGDGSLITKEAVVYLPYGYSEAGKYDVIYLMHGWTGNNRSFFEYDDSDALKNTLDNMIERGDIRPVILITPTFDRNNESTTLEVAVSEIRYFHEELVNELMPAIEAAFSVYPMADHSGRDHRAFAGFSLGATITWDVFYNDMEYFRYFLPMSGSSWLLQDQATDLDLLTETAEAFASKVIEDGYSSSDFTIITAVGSEDVAFFMADNMVTGLLTQSEVFNDSNVDYLFNVGAVHWWDAMPQNLYHALMRVFPSL